MAKAKEELKQICFPTDIIMDYDPIRDAYWTHKLLMKEIVETFQKKYGVNLLRNNPHMKCYLLDEKLEELVPVRDKGLGFRFQDAINNLNAGAIAPARNWDIQPVEQQAWGNLFNIDAVAPVAPPPAQIRDEVVGEPVDRQEVQRNWF